MNKRFIILSASVIAITIVVIAGCKKPYDEDKDIGAPVYSTEKLNASINGSWQMQSAVQVDEKSLTKESIDISDFLISGNAKAPNVNFNAATRTFTVDTAGLTVNYLMLASGKWAFDDDRYPTKVKIMDNAGNAVSEIAISKNLLSASPQLAYQQSVDCDDAKAISYNIVFIKK